VGMSNRSYFTVTVGLMVNIITFNSPWECRIGLTIFMLVLTI